MTAIHWYTGRRTRTYWTCAVLCQALCVPLHGALYPVNAPIPDNSPVGLTDSRTVSGLGSSITDLRVTLSISGGYNGDLYGYLRLNNSPLVVLVNRTGVTSTDPDGYANTGFLVTLTADPAAHDIHFYQDHGPSYNGSGQVTGTWQADGRPDPLGTTRSSLSAFNGLDPNGTWTLFFADRSPGAQSTLAGWSLDITAVPEPVNVALAIFGGVSVLVMVTRSQLMRERITRWRAAAGQWLDAV
jgi:subtilisin-like proprotein convertase family protein